MGVTDPPPPPEPLHPVYPTPEACSKCGHSPCVLGFGSFTTGNMFGFQEHHAIAGAYRRCPECQHVELRAFARKILDDSTETCRRANEHEARLLARRLLSSSRGKTLKEYKNAQEAFLRACDICQLDSQKVLSEENQKLLAR